MSMTTRQTLRTILSTAGITAPVQARDLQMLTTAGFRRSGSSAHATWHASTVTAAQMAALHALRARYLTLRINRVMDEYVATLDQR